MLKSSLCDYSHAYILVKGTLSIKQVQSSAAPDNDGKEAVFKHCGLFTYCISEINNTKIVNAKEL